MNLMKFLKFVILQYGGFNMEALKQLKKLKIGRIITYTAAICSIVALALTLFIIQSKENILIEVACHSYKLLTPAKDVEPDLVTKHFFKGKEIHNLWKVNVSFKNISPKTTIIAHGNKKNIMFDNIRILVKDNYQIIDKELFRKDLSHEIKIENGNEILINFNQWRKNENLEYSFFIKVPGKEEIVKDLFSEPEQRQVVDGDIVFTFREKSKKAKTNYWNLIPVFLFVTTLLFLLMIGAFFTFYAIKMPIDYYRINRYNIEKRKGIITNDTSLIEFLLYEIFFIIFATFVFLIFFLVLKEFLTNFVP